MAWRIVPLPDASTPSRRIGTGHVSDGLGGPTPGRCVTESGQSRAEDACITADIRGRMPRAPERRSRPQTVVRRQCMAYQQARPPATRSSGSAGSCCSSSPSSSGSGVDDIGMLSVPQSAWSSFASCWLCGRSSASCWSSYVVRSKARRTSSCPISVRSPGARSSCGVGLDRLRCSILIKLDRGPGVRRRRHRQHRRLEVAQDRHLRSASIASAGLRRPAPYLNCQGVRRARRARSGAAGRRGDAAFAVSVTLDRRATMRPRPSGGMSSREQRRVSRRPADAASSAHSTPSRLRPRRCSARDRPVRRRSRRGSPIVVLAVARSSGRYDRSATAGVWRRTAAATRRAFVGYACSTRSWVGACRLSARVDHRRRWSLCIDSSGHGARRRSHDRATLTLCAGIGSSLARRRPYGRTDARLPRPASSWSRASSCSSAGRQRSAASGASSTRPTPITRASASALVATPSSTALRCALVLGLVIRSPVGARIAGARVGAASALDRVGGSRDATPARSAATCATRVARRSLDRGSGDRSASPGSARRRSRPRRLSSTGASAGQAARRSSLGYEQRQRRARQRHARRLAATGELTADRGRPATRSKPSRRSLTPT